MADESEADEIGKQLLKAVTILAQLLVGFAGGWAIWRFSPWITGKVEPWDDGGLFYFAALFAVSLLAVLVHPGTSWFAMAGPYVGQWFFIDSHPELFRGPVIFPAAFSLILIGGLPQWFGRLGALGLIEFFKGYRDAKVGRQCPPVAKRGGRNGDPD